ncbi:alternative ribosome rescue aminoacyl-tRNA hydrolase ArfB [Microvirga sp. 2TAF3]|uniref:alternative ribosome rescue aminoacyl-tRNA hydrolase ArfB n=1 Tax=Microvirga sp. 2TAF3 TaxID=3233014 RepID=UPI003F9AD692
MGHRPAARLPIIQDRHGVDEAPDKRFPKDSVEGKLSIALYVRYLNSSAARAFMIPITPSLSIDENEIEETFIRSSGPGGQHVNTSSTAVQLRFDARRSRSLPDDVAVRLMKIAGSRLTQDGVIVITAQTHRSQQRNREEALARLVDLIRQATVRRKTRRPTKPTKASMERRLQSKEKRSLIKSGRRTKFASE